MEIKSGQRDLFKRNEVDHLHQRKYEEKRKEDFFYKGMNKIKTLWNNI